jgi:two-component system OmpR family response regulator
VVSDREQQPITLVDDDVEVADMIDFALTSAGYTVQLFYSGPEALDALLALPSDTPQRMVIIAVDLAGLDGHTLHEQLVLARPDTFLVAFLSNRWSDADQIRALTAGAVDYLMKPVSIPVLIAKVTTWLHLCTRKE